LNDSIERKMKLTKLNLYLIQLALCEETHLIKPLQGIIFAQFAYLAKFYLPSIRTRQTDCISLF